MKVQRSFTIVPSVDIPSVRTTELYSFLAPSWSISRFGRGLRPRSALSFTLLLPFLQNVLLAHFLLPSVWSVRRQRDWGLEGMGKRAGKLTLSSRLSKMVEFESWTEVDEDGDFAMLWVLRAHRARNRAQRRMLRPSVQLTWSLAIWHTSPHVLCSYAGTIGTLDLGHIALPNPTQRPVIVLCAIHQYRMLSFSHYLLNDQTGHTESSRFQRSSVLNTISTTIATSAPSRRVTLFIDLQSSLDELGRR